MTGVANVAEVTGWQGESPAPFVVAVNLSNNIHVTRQYYIWLFGPVVRVPFKRTYPEPHPVGSLKPNAWGFLTCTATWLTGVRTGTHPLSVLTKLLLRNVQR